MFTKKFLISLLTATVLVPFMALAAGVPADVANVTATAESDTAIKLSWDATLDENSQPVAKYRIYYGTFSVFAAGEGEYQKQVDTPTNATTYTVTGLTANTSYYFAVTALSSDAQESNQYSYEATAKTKKTATPAPNPIPAEVEDKTSPTVSSAKSEDATHVSVIFSEAVTLPVSNAKSAFSITEQINPAKTLKVINAALDPKDATGKTVLLETDTQGKNVNYLVTAGAAITDTFANPIVSGNTDTALFTGTDSSVAEPTTPAEVTMLETPAPELTSEPVKDVTPPENITSLVLSWKAQAEKFIILMDWKASLDTAKDLADQIMYMSLDRGTTYNAGQSLGAKAVHSEVPNLEGGKEYTFKITTKDASGNESTGAVKAIRLPSSGPAAGLLLLGAAEGARRMLRRKKQK
jgi:hypothetical protein